MSSDSDDDRLDDPALHSMRAVWLSMRDEEPPAAGLAELLAAARVKAEAMQPKEPWWRRTLAALRRPPVLALATVIVLLGGAVLVGSKREQLDAMPKAERRDLEAGRAGAAPTKLALDERSAAMTPPALAKDGTAAVADPAPKGYAAAPDLAAGPAAAPGHAAAPGVAADPADVASAEPERPAAAVASGAPAGVAGSAGPARPTTTAPRPVVPPSVSGAVAESKQEITAAAPPPPPPPPTPPPASPAIRENSGGVPPSADAARGESEKRKNALDQTPAPAMAPNSVRRPAPKQDLQIADDASTSSLGGVQTTGSAPRIRNPGADAEQAEGKPVRGPTLGQLAKQSETAASRGDCPAVRAIVGRIRKLDAAFHKEHVQNNAAVKRCVK